MELYHRRGCFKGDFTTNNNWNGRIDGRLLFSVCTPLCGAWGNIRQSKEYGRYSCHHKGLQNLPNYIGLRERDPDTRELLAIASFYPTFMTLGCNIEEITQLYCITILSTTVCGVLLEIVDFGTRKAKCVLCASLYFTALFSLCCDDHYDMLMLGRVIYGAATALHHGLDQSAFEAYVINQHTTQGFPDDWLNNTFSIMAHSVALVAAISGMIGQTASSSGSLGVAGLCCVIFAFAVVYIVVLWPQDVASPRFMLSGFLSNAKQTLETAKTNVTMQHVLGISALYESAIVIFTFYWAPWMAGMIEDEAGELPPLPYETIYASMIVASMIGNYLFSIYVVDIGAEKAFQYSLLGTASLFGFSSLLFSATLSFWCAVGVQLCIGVYWPCIGTLKGKLIAPEMRTPFTAASRVLTLIISYMILHTSHDSPFLVLLLCGGLAGLAGYLHITLISRHDLENDDGSVVEYTKDDD